MKKIIVAVSLLVILMFVVSCAPEASEKELKEGLSELSDDDLDNLIEETGAEDGSALAGQAFLSKRGYTINTGRVSRDKLLISAQRLKIERLENEIEAGFVNPGETGGVTPTEYGLPLPEESGIESPGETKGFNPQPEPPAGDDGSFGDSIEN